MKRDMDLVRKILLDVEAHESLSSPQKLQLQGYSEEQLGYHVLIMAEAGLLETLGVDSTFVDLIRRMTWQGHDFLDACRDETRWNKAKGVLAKLGGGSLEVLKHILTELAKASVTALIQ